jgi:hypothetical protein
MGPVRTAFISDMLNIYEEAGANKQTKPILYTFYSVEYTDFHERSVV